MRCIVIIGLFTATLAHAAWNGYTEERNLELDSDGVSRLEIDAGAGSLVVTGVEGLDRIEVTATIQVPDEDAGDALEVIEDHLVLSLDKVRDEARLVAKFEAQSGFWGDSPSVALDVRVPHGIAMLIDDSSGSIKVMETHSDLRIDDGSGSIRVEQVQSVVIDDGSGSITVVGVAGDVEIEDGSGSITVENVGGGVTIDDGSGGINVTDVELDLVIVVTGWNTLPNRPYLDTNEVIERVLTAGME